MTIYTRNYDISNIDALFSISRRSTNGLMIKSLYHTSFRRPHIINNPNGISIVKYNHTARLHLRTNSFHTLIKDTLNRDMLGKPYFSKNRNTFDGISVFYGNEVITADLNTTDEIISSNIVHYLKITSGKVGYDMLCNMRTVWKIKSNGYINIPDTTKRSRMLKGILK